MKTKQLLLVLVAFLFVTIVGCGKYEDGPKISFASKTGRLVNKWKQEKSYVNNVEATIDTAYIFEIKKDNTFNITQVGSSNATIGTWVFDGNKDNILVTQTILGMPITISYKILRLKSNELWVSSVSGTYTFEDHYVTE